MTAVQPSAAARLHIDVEKQMGSFQLRVSLDAGTGITVLFGPSGAGKSTTLNVIAGLLHPDAGEILLDGRALFDKAKGGARRPRPIDVPARERGIGYVFQQYALFPHMTALENVAYPLIRQRDGCVRAADLLARVRLAHLAERYPHELSGGQQQRVAIARALAAGPRVLLLDEPFSALDTAVRERLQQDLSAWQAELELVVLYVTHRLEDAFAIGHRLVVMREGQVIQCGQIDEVYRSPADYDVAEIMGVRNLFRARVVSADPERLILDWDGLRLEAPPQAAAPSSALTAYIRPEDIKVLYPDRPLAITVRHNVVAGRVVASRLGTGVRTLRVALTNGHEVEVRASDYAYLPLDLSVGSRVQLSLRKPSVVVLPAQT